jgi:DNA-binding transcriptional regulator YdaS (Cro superfamily)
MVLIEYIKKEHGGNQAAFAQAQGVKPPQVTQWINKEFIVVNGVLYSPRRALK